MRGSGFYASKGHHDVFAYDAATGEGVWIRMGTQDCLNEDLTHKWEMPLPLDLDDWLTKYGFSRLSPEAAASEVVRYSVGMREDVNYEEF